MILGDKINFLKCFTPIGYLDLKYKYIDYASLDLYTAFEDYTLFDIIMRIRDDENDEEAANWCEDEINELLLDCFYIKWMLRR